MNWKPILCLLFLVGCGGAISGTTSGGGALSDPDGAGSTGGEVSETEVTSESAPTPETLRALAHGDHSVIRRSHGVRIAEYGTDPGGESPFSNEEGVVERAQLLCNEALDAWLASLAEEWDYRMEDEYTAPTCSGDVCEFQFMGEYDRAPQLTFIRVEGALVLHSVVAVERGAVGPEFIETGERFTANAIAEMADQRCAP